MLESLEEVTGRRFDAIRIVGGGSRNRLLNQFTADATGRTVLAGPVEATALGNIAMQMLATGAVTLARRGAGRHRSIVPGRAIRAVGDGSMGRAIPALPATTWSSPVPDAISADSKFLDNLWNDREAGAGRAIR